MGKLREAFDTGEWVKMVRDVGFPIAACLILISVGCTFGVLFLNAYNVNAKAARDQAAKEADAKQSLTEKLAASIIDVSQRTTVTLAKMEEQTRMAAETMQTVQGMSRKQLETDKELLSIQKEIRDEVKQQGKLMAPRPGTPNGAKRGPT